MAKKKNHIIRLLSLVIAILMCSITAFNTFAENAEETGTKTSAYDKLDINSLTGHGEEPEELSTSADATYQEKAWYEYVTYSENAVCSYRLDDDSRLLFYDPYTYSNAMIMDVQDDVATSNFDTMSEYSISTTSSKSILSAAESTYTNTSSVQSSGKDTYGSNVTNSGKTKTTYNHEQSNYTTGTVSDKTSYDYIKKDTSSTSVSTSLNSATAVGASTTGVSVNETITIGYADQNSSSEVWLQNGVTKETIYSDNYKSSVKTEGYDEVEVDTKSETTGWEQLSDRVTKTLGSSFSTSTSWSESESTTVTKTYAATHFASDGITPLPWKVVHYTVQMPMKCCLQYKVNGEWVTISTVYVMLTTVHGTCRAWMQDSQVYYEDWGNGEPVTATDFWSQFMTKDQLINAYTNKLYPTGGEN